MADDKGAERELREAERRAARQARAIAYAQDEIDDADAKILRFRRRAVTARILGFVMVAFLATNEIRNGAWVWTTLFAAIGVIMFAIAGSASSDLGKAETVRRKAERKLRDATMGWNE